MSHISEPEKENQKPEQNRARAADQGAQMHVHSFDASVDFSIIDYIPVDMVIVDRKGHVVAFNRAKRTSGRRLPQIGDRMYKDYASRHKIDMYREMMDCIENGTIKTFSEQEYYDQWLSITISPFPGGAVILSRDITQQKRAEVALQESEKEKEMILSSVMETLTYQDLDLKIVWTNRAAAESVKMTPGNMVGRYCYQVWANRESACDNCPLKTVIQKNQYVQAEKTSEDGRIWAMRGYPVHDGTGKIAGVVGVRLDITRQKKAEEEKEAIQQQLFQSHKLEAIGTLAGGVAHDFNNLLTAIQGTLDMIVTKFPADHQIQRDLKDLQKSASRAADLTRQLLLFSRKHPIHFSALNVNTVVDNILKLLHRLIGEDIQISTAFQKDLWEIMADPGTVEQVIMNLTVNARDAMPNGGKITIKTENVFINESYAKIIPDARPGRFVRLTIADNGVGIPKKNMPHIFEPFFTTKSSDRGTGLGLSVVYGIVKQHEGWINAYSEPKEGTEIRIYLSAEGVNREKRSQKAIPIDTLQGRGEAVLVIEDEMCVLNFARRALMKNGYCVIAVSSAAEAIATFEKEKDRIHLVFSDVVLPDGNGVELIERFLNKKPDLRMLLTSGYTDKKAQWLTIQEKKYPFLQKPYALFNLLNAVKETLAVHKKIKQN